MTTDERQRMIDRLEDAEGNLARAMRCVDVGHPWRIHDLVYEAHAEVRAVRLAMQEEQT